MSLITELEQTVEVINAQISALGFTNLRGAGVFDDALEPTEYVYSVGFSEQNQPEIIITAMVVEDMYIRKITKAFQTLYQAYRKAGNDLTAEDSFTLDDFKLSEQGDEALRFKACRLDDATRTVVLNDYMQMIEFRLGAEKAMETEVIQLLIADKGNVLPGEVGYMEWIPQPILTFA